MKISPALRERFIITADDYGVRQTAVPILQLAREKKIDRAAVLVNSVTPEDVQNLLETGVKIDIHLDLIELLKRGDTPGDSTFFRGASFLRHYIAGDLAPERVRGAWESQMERFKALFGRLPDGMNSHEHVHYFPPLFQVFTSLAEKYEIPYIRFGQAGTLLDYHSSFIGRVLSFYIRRNYRLFQKKNIPTSDYLLSYDWLADFEETEEKLPSGGTIELVIHPERENEYIFARETF